MFGCTMSNLKKDLPYGEEIDIRGSSKISGELVALTDSSIIVYLNQEYIELEKEQINTITLADVNLGSKYLSGVFVTLFYGYAVNATFENDETPTGLLFLTGGVLSIYTFFIHNPDQSFAFPQNEEERYTLSKYCRYPLGITRNQLDSLLKSNDQVKILRELQTSHQAIK